MLSATVVLPTPEYFPDRYDGSEQALQAMFSGLCGVMQVKAQTMKLEVAYEANARTTAFKRSEKKPTWRKHLASNISGYFNRSAVWLSARGRSCLG